MKNLRSYITAVLMLIASSTFAQTTTAVNHFDKVIVSPHVQVTFVEGNEETVTIEKSTVDQAKINIEVNHSTLRIYLDDAKEITKNRKTYENGYQEKRSIYNGTVVTAIVTYKKLVALSIRGEETQVCKSLLKADNFKLKIYGTSKVYLNEVKLEKLQTTMYGESLLVIKAGSIQEQKYTVYGESEINSLGINGNAGKITAYGEADFKLNVSDEIHITAFGEAKLGYKGNPVISKGLNIGGTQISRIE